METVGSGRDLGDEKVAGGAGGRWRSCLSASGSGCGGGWRCGSTRRWRRGSRRRTWCRRSTSRPSSGWTTSAAPEMPFGVWVRLLADQRLIEVHRRHLGAQARGAGREVGHWAGTAAATASDGLAARLAGDLTSPSQAAIRHEVHEILTRADRGDGPDRPRGPRAPPLRRAEQRRGRPPPRHPQGDGQQALRPRPRAAPGGPGAGAGAVR